ncbi:MAG: SDR family oxidoreductase [Pseudomonadota bacterium]
MSKQQGPLDLAELRGSVAVVTGAGNNGIGWGIAVHAARELGMQVAIIDLHAHLAAAAAERLQALCPDVQILGLGCDVTDPGALAQTRDTIVHTFAGRIGALFANAGVIFNHTIMKSTPQEWQTTLNVNILGVVNTLQAFTPQMQAHREASVICTTASVGGLVRGDGGGASYQASKHAVVALTESFSFELARRHPQIRVHVLCPCIVRSGLMVTSQTNAKAHSGDLDPEEINPFQPGEEMIYAMTPERHAQQVFDLIAKGDFYMITDNVRPYVDHDHPFDGLGIVRERLDNLLDLQLDNADAFESGPHGSPTSILKGPMFEQVKAARQADQGDAS